MAFTTPKSESYYITAFTIEGHKRWRAHMAQEEGLFQTQWDNQQGKKPKITAKKVFKLNRVTGEVTPN